MAITDHAVEKVVCKCGCETFTAEIGSYKFNNEDISIFVELKCTECRNTIEKEVYK